MEQFICFCLSSFKYMQSGHFLKLHWLAISERIIFFLHKNIQWVHNESNELSEIFRGKFLEDLPLQIHFCMEVTIFSNIRPVWPEVTVIFENFIGRAVYIYTFR